jgi:hypothetical protein
VAPSPCRHASGIYQFFIAAIDTVFRFSANMRISGSGEVTFWRRGDLHIRCTAYFGREMRATGERCEQPAKMMDSSYIGSDALEDQRGPRENLRSLDNAAIALSGGLAI